MSDMAGSELAFLRGQQMSSQWNEEINGASWEWSEWDERHRTRRDGESRG